MGSQPSTRAEYVPRVMKAPDVSTNSQIYDGLPPPIPPEEAARHARAARLSRRRIASHMAALCVFIVLQVCSSAPAKEPGYKVIPWDDLNLEDSMPIEEIRKKMRDRSGDHSEMLYSAREWDAEGMVVEDLEFGKTGIGGTRKLLSGANGCSIRVSNLCNEETNGISLDAFSQIDWRRISPSLGAWMVKTGIAPYIFNSMEGETSNLYVNRCASEPGADDYLFFGKVTNTVTGLPVFTWLQYWPSPYPSVLEERFTIDCEKY